MDHVPNEQHRRSTTVSIHTCLGLGYGYGRVGSQVQLHGKMLFGGEHFPIPRFLELFSYNTKPQRGKEE